jgi:riboflavin kinase/FMN adenylyltransferase
MKVIVAEALAGEKISSSRIRNLITLGEVEKANTMLGYPYFLTGKVSEGKQIGRQIGFPTANLSVPKEKLLPACGVYSVWVSLPDHTKKAGMLCIGHRPTVEKDGKISVEAHIFDYHGNLYGSSISIDFIAKLRDEKHFDSLDDLQKQLALDAVSARTICNNSL